MKNDTFKIVLKYVAGIIKVGFCKIEIFLYELQNWFLMCATKNTTVKFA